MGVSVIIPVFNAEKFIAAAVESALFHNCVKEIILVEDGSSDNSYQKCKFLEQKYEKVKLITHNNRENKGAGVSRNLGIYKATQEYLSFLDADDYYLENRFDDLKLLEASDIDGYYGAFGIEFVDEVGKEKWENSFKKNKRITKINKLVAPLDLFDYFMGKGKEYNAKGWFHISTLTIKRQKICDHKIYFPEIRLHQDTIFILKCAYLLTISGAAHNKIIGIRRVHKGNRITSVKDIKKTQAVAYKSFFSWMAKRGYHAKSELVLLRWKKLEKSKFQLASSIFLILATNFHRVSFTFHTIKTLFYSYIKR